MNETTWVSWAGVSGFLLYAPWIMLGVLVVLMVVLMVVGSRWGPAWRGSEPSEESRYRIIGGIYHTLQETSAALTSLEQRIAAIERHAEHEREIRTLMLERLSPRTRSTRKTPPREE
jgi:hypothetical protein